MNSRLAAFLKTITDSELSPAVVEQSDQGFNVLLGSVPGQVLTFSSYNNHPKVLIHVGQWRSTAAGAFQILWPTWFAYKSILQLSDFGPDSQRAVAVQLIKECKALGLAQSESLADVSRAFSLCSSRWASLPGNDYGQHQQKMEWLLSRYDVHLKQGQA